MKRRNSKTNKMVIKLKQIDFSRKFMTLKRKSKNMVLKHLKQMLSTTNVLKK